ncbi:alpha/beta hydrolase [Leptolyngbya sp. NK1-12]|uniref:Alpha/beta hydrolase n=1 Tax=Leptolyngbya sp. NK1-12 TaxID=2547451 RepID=A0AA96WIG7_9CYAN|nr:hypothetical protein [Leptolyngbya sp. NK1-12]WNZ25780.1 alpha/beta hydrolase [Leptolyngbya sp. NK1-12]
MSFNTTFGHRSGKYLEVDEAKIYYEVIGDRDRPTLLVLHGGFGNLEDFNSVLSELKEEFQIIGIDNRGQINARLNPFDLRANAKRCRSYSRTPSH